MANIKKKKKICLVRDETKRIKNVFDIYVRFRNMNFMKIHSFCSLSYDRSIASSKASSLAVWSSAFSLMLLLSVSIILSFSWGYPIASYVLFVVFPLLPHSIFP